MGRLGLCSHGARSFYLFDDIQRRYGKYSAALYRFFRSRYKYYVFGGPRFVFSSKRNSDVRFLRRTKQKYRDEAAFGYGYADKRPKGGVQSLAVGYNPLGPVCFHIPVIDYNDRYIGGKHEFVYRRFCHGVFDFV